MGIFSSSSGSASLNRSRGKADGFFLSSRGKEAQAELEAAAKRDGVSGMPGLNDATPSQYELQIRQQAQQWMANTLADFRRRDAELYPRFVKARKDFRDALRQYETKKLEQGDRPVDIQLTPLVYWPLMLTMALCEAAVNFIAFEALFPDARWVAMLASGVLAVVLVFAAHSVGAAVQQKRNIGWAFLVTVISLAMMFGLAYLRFAYIEFDNENASGSQIHPKLNADMVTGFFLVFNLLFLVMASWLAAKLHDKDQTYEQRYRNYLRTRELLVAEKQVRDRSQWEYRRAAVDEEGLHRKLVAQYRDLNMQHREMKATPRIWVELPPDKLIQYDLQLFDLHDNQCSFEAELEKA